MKFVRSFPSENKYIDRYFKNVAFATKRFDELNKDEEGTRIFDIMRNDK